MFAKAGPLERSVSNTVPELDEVLLVLEKAPADRLCLGIVGVHECLEVALNVRPASLAPRQRPPVVARPAIADEDAEHLAENLPRDIAATGVPDQEDRDLVRRLLMR